MSTQRKHLEKVITSAAKQKLTGFEESVNTLISTKLLAAIQARKPVVAQRMFGERAKLM